VGPNLDASFRQARADGMDADTIEGVVQGQIENPREITLPEDDPSYSRVFMPANLVEGQDAEDVAAYVASVAGVPGVEPDLPPEPGAQVFVSNGCGACHTLKALGELAVGASGPDLDQALPGQSAKQIEESIVDPSADVVAGFADIMPGTFGDTLTPQELKDLVDFLIQRAGKGG
jgi:mono/diheme cytochrome c family protein